MTPEEFEKFVVKLRPQLVFFAKGFVSDGAATAEDMVQDAIIRLWNFEEIRNPEVLLRHILRNVCLDYIKLKKNNTERLVPGYKNELEISPAESFENKEQLTLIYKYMISLPKEQMLALRLRDIMGYEMHEIAEILDMSEGNVRTLLSRARKKMREKLDKKWR